MMVLSLNYPNTIHCKARITFVYLCCIVPFFVCALSLSELSSTVQPKQSSESGHHSSRGDVIWRQALLCKTGKGRAGVPAMVFIVRIQAVPSLNLNRNSETCRNHRISIISRRATAVRTRIRF